MKRVITGDFRRTFTEFKIIFFMPFCPAHCLIGIFQQRINIIPAIRVQAYSNAYANVWFMRLYSKGY